MSSNGATHGGVVSVAQVGQAGADGRNRTAYLLITNQLLYRMSYVGSGMQRF